MPVCRVLGKKGGQLPRTGQCDTEEDENAEKQMLKLARQKKIKDYRREEQNVDKLRNSRWRRVLARLSC
jgi:hypothetical protein